MFVENTAGTQGCRPELVSGQLPSSVLFLVRALEDKNKISKTRPGIPHLPSGSGASAEER
jgi:hypothetical protein